MDSIFTIAIGSMLSASPLGFGLFAFLMLRSLEGEQTTEAAARMGRYGVIALICGAVSAVIIAIFYAVHIL